HIHDLAGTYATDSTVAVGPMSTVDLTADAIGLQVTGADTDGIIGFADEADAA
ncbi:unnamed protein product, partial [marine sediment metagenome]